MRIPLPFTRVDLAACTLAFAPRGAGGRIAESRPSRAGRYEGPVRRALCGIAAAVLTTLTLGVLVILPALTSTDGPERRAQVARADIHTSLAEPVKQGLPQETGALAVTRVE